MVKKLSKKFLNFINSKPIIGAGIFIMLSLVMVLAGNVVVKDGSINIENNFNSSGVLFVNSVLGNVGIGTSSPNDTLTVKGDASISGSLNVSGNTYLSYNELTIGENKNNLLIGNGTYFYTNINEYGPYNIYGITGGESGRVIVINVYGDYGLNFYEYSSFSNYANRLVLYGGGSENLVVVSPGESIRFIYHGPYSQYYPNNWVRF
jgi:hypothetical protein